MNKDIFEGKWKEMRGQAKEWWGKLTDDDLDKAGGKAEQIVGLLQQKYGYTKERAEEEFNRRLRDAKDTAHDVKRDAKYAARDAKAKAKDVAQDVKSKVKDVARDVEHKSGAK